MIEQRICPVCGNLKGDDPVVILPRANMWVHANCVTEDSMVPRYIQIVKRRFLSQKYYAKFIADNNLVLSRTEHYHNLADLQSMLATYFPDWRVELP